MPMGLGAAGIITGGTLGAGIIGASSASRAARESAKAAREMQEKQIAWEREAATHAHQWEVEDLRAAGLNPILSAGGSGASAGSISTPMPDYSGKARSGEIIANAVNSAITQVLESQKVKNDTTKTDAEVEQTQAQTQLTEQQIISEAERSRLISKQVATEMSKQILNYSQAEKLDKETKRIIATLELEREKLRVEIERAKANKDFQQIKVLEERFNKNKQTLNYMFDKAEQITKILATGVNSAANAIRAVKS